MADIALFVSRKRLQLLTKIGTIQLLLGTSSASPVGQCATATAYY